MPDKSKDPEKSKWLLKPPAADEANIAISIGDQAQVSPELLDALQDLADRLKAGAAGGETAKQMECAEVVIGECRTHMTCQGVTIT